MFIETHFPVSADCWDGAAAFLCLDGMRTRLHAEKIVVVSNEPSENMRCDHFSEWCADVRRAPEKAQHPSVR
jgi:hypothetical protein